MREDDRVFMDLFRLEPLLGRVLLALSRSVPDFDLAFHFSLEMLVLDLGALAAGEEDGFLEADVTAFAAVDDDADGGIFTTSLGLLIPVELFAFNNFLDGGLGGRAAVNAL